MTPPSAATVNTLTHISPARCRRCGRAAAARPCSACWHWHQRCCAFSRPRRRPLQPRRPRPRRAHAGSSPSCARWDRASRPMGQSSTSRCRLGQEAGYFGCLCRPQATKKCNVPALLFVWGLVCRPRGLTQLPAPRYQVDVVRYEPPPSPTDIATPPDLRDTCDGLVPPLRCALSIIRQSSIRRVQRSQALLVVICYMLTWESQPRPAKRRDREHNLEGLLGSISKCRLSCRVPADPRRR